MQFKQTQRRNTLTHAPICTGILFEHTHTRVYEKESIQSEYLFHVVSFTHRSPATPFCPCSQFSIATWFAPSRSHTVVKLAHRLRWVCIWQDARAADSSALRSLSFPMLIRLEFRITRMANNTTILFGYLLLLNNTHIYRSWRACVRICVVLVCLRLYNRLGGLEVNALS